MTMKTKEKKQIVQAPKGTYDILPADQPYWERVRSAVRDVAFYYGFQRIDTPLFEFGNLFERGVGAATDIVEKQMYSFSTKGGDHVVLRPEGTAGVMRAYIEHGLFSLGQPARLYYIGPMFRYESPQKGRSRQFYQAGFEVIGDPGPVYDAQTILLASRVFQEMKIKNPLVQINSLGCKTCRPNYRNRLKAYYKIQWSEVCKDCKHRFAVNPLRLLDCKEEKDIAIKKGAPVMIDDLCPLCHEHFKSVLEFLDALKIPYQLDPHLVRGLDYYARTVFEFVPPGAYGEGISVSQNALASGGRYDYLAEMLGGRATAGVGVAIGLDRVVEYVKDQGLLKLAPVKPRVYIVQLGDVARRKALQLMEEFRRADIAAGESLGRDSMKTQLRIADKAGADIALIIGQKEAHEDNVILRDMSSGSQETVPVEKIVNAVRKKLARKR